MSTSLITEKFGGCPSGPRIRFLFLSIGEDSGVVAAAVVDVGGRHTRRALPCRVVLGKVGLVGVRRGVHRRRRLVSRSSVRRRHTSSNCTTSPFTAPRYQQDVTVPTSSIMPASSVPLKSTVTMICPILYRSAAHHSTILLLLLLLLALPDLRVALTFSRSTLCIYTRPEYRRIDEVAVESAYDPSLTYAIFVYITNPRVFDNGESRVSSPWMQMMMVMIISDDEVAK